MTEMVQRPCTSSPESWDEQQPGEIFNDYVERIDEAKFRCDTECRFQTQCREDVVALREIRSGVVAGRLYDMGVQEPWPERQPDSQAATWHVCRCLTRFWARRTTLLCEQCRERAYRAARAHRAVMPHADNSDGCGHRRWAA